jgi:hypothetical protein
MVAVAVAADMAVAGIIKIIKQAANQRQMQAVVWRIAIAA